jgi:hypothetical protein
MANVDAACGFIPVRHLTGGEIRLAELTIASGYNTALAIGDPVELTGTADNIQEAAAQNVDNIGIFCGCEYVDAQGQPVISNYWPAGTVTKNAAAAKALVWRDPLIVYRVQCDTLAAADVGALADWDTGAPSATTRLSGVELVASSTGTTAKAIRILGLSKIPNNEYGAYAKADVVFAEHALLTGANGAGGV